MPDVLDRIMAIIGHEKPLEYLKDMNTGSVLVNNKHEGRLIARVFKVGKYYNFAYAIDVGNVLSRIGKRITNPVIRKEYSKIIIRHDDGVINLDFRYKYYREFTALWIGTGACFADDDGYMCLQPRLALYNVEDPVEAGITIGTILLAVVIDPDVGELMFDTILLSGIEKISGLARIVRSILNALEDVYVVKGA